jgi:hypothetical protein
MLPRSVAVLPCHLGWRTLLKCNKTNHACLIMQCFLRSIFMLALSCARHRVALELMGARPALTRFSEGLCTRNFLKGFASSGEACLFHGLAACAEPLT